VSGTERLDETTETLVYRAAQEAVRNIVRHADATVVTLTVARSERAVSGRREQSLVMRVRDDGCGFEAGRNTARSRGSVGLDLLSALVASHGGTLSVESPPTRGTELILTVPLGPAGDPSAAAAERESVSPGVRP